MDWKREDGIRWLEAGLPGARAAFSTRGGGVSTPPYESLNVAVKTGDEPGRVADNRRRLAAALGLAPANVLMGHQVHGAELLWHGRPQSPPVFADVVPSPVDVDAHATDQPGLAPLVMTADCLPVALAGPGGVAMAHGGWRGLAAGILERAADSVHARAAAVGPGIGSCCYEVGGDVLSRFAGLDGVAEGRALDLAAVARALLERAGVTEVEVAGVCTSCNPDLFYSHRRDGARTGRQCGIAWLEGDSGGDADGG